MLKGKCLCGAVSFTAVGEVGEATACHCSQCRRQSGHFWVAAEVTASKLAISGAVRWYDASPKARRGFCPSCGSFLFWHAHGKDLVDVALGALEQPTGLRLARHIFTADKGDYYDIADGLPQFEGESGA